MSILNEQQGEKNDIQIMCEKLDDIRGKVKEIKTKIKENIDKFNKNLESLENAIKNYIVFLNQGNDEINNIKSKIYFTEDIRKNIELFFDSVTNISYSKNLNIIDSRKQIYKLLDEFIKYDFYPNYNDVIIHFNQNASNNISQFSDIQNISQNRMNLFNDINELQGEEQKTFTENDINGYINYKCFLCNNKASYVYLNKKYCVNCIIIFP